MPISLANPCENLTIKRLGGSDKMKLHLRNLGFIEGEPIMIVSKINQNVIVKKLREFPLLSLMNLQIRFLCK